MRKKSLLLAFAFAWGLTLTADSLDDVKANPCITASNHYAYPDKDLPELTPTPEGYEPFYMSHYGRHGSRWLCGKNEYDLPVAALEGIDRAGKLTQLGKETLDNLKRIQNHAYERWGELTEIGAEQHQRIGRRMARNFPEIFSGQGKHVDAISSVVNRCVLSMTNEAQELKAFNPALDITTDASQSYMWLLARGATHGLRKHAKEAVKMSEDFRRQRTRSERFVNSLVSDKEYARDSVDGFALIRAIFHVAGILQNHHTDMSLYSLFTPEELHAIWETENASHYVDYSAAPQSEGLMPFGETHLLREIIAQADSAITCGAPAANLRFGHEVFFLPLACLMELGNTAPRIEHMEDISEHWRSYEIFPMACNIQLIFYRNHQDNDILVKALLNEHEVTIPVTTDKAPYYHWDDVKRYYTEKLNRFSSAHPDLMPTVPADYSPGKLKKSL